MRVRVCIFLVIYYLRIKNSISKLNSETCFFRLSFHSVNKKNALDLFMNEYITEFAFVQNYDFDKDQISISKENSHI